MSYKPKDLADQLVEQAEQNRRLRKLSSKASGVATLLTGKEEIELLGDQVRSELPVLFLNLNHRKAFFEKKEATNGHVANLNKELKRVERYLDMVEKVVSLHELKEINEYINHINEHYSFDA